MCSSRQWLGDEEPRIESCGAPLENSTSSSGRLRADHDDDELTDFVSYLDVRYLLRDITNPAAKHGEWRLWQIRRISGPFVFACCVYSHVHLALLIVIILKL